MNNDLKNALTTDVRNLMEWFGAATMTWNGNNYTCIAGRLSETAELGRGGDLNQYAGSLTLLRADLTNGIPAPGDTVTVNGRALFVERVVAAPDHPIVTLHLTAADNPFSDA